MTFKPSERRAYRQTLNALVNLSNLNNDWSFFAMLSLNFDILDLTKGSLSLTLPKPFSSTLYITSLWYHCIHSSFPCSLGDPPTRLCPPSFSIIPQRHWSIMPISSLIWSMQQFMLAKTRRISHLSLDIAALLLLRYLLAFWVFKTLLYPHMLEVSWFHVLSFWMTYRNTGPHWKGW